MFENAGSFICWKSCTDLVIISNIDKDKTVHHIVVPVENHSNLVEAVSCLKKSFTYKYQFPVTKANNNASNDASNEVSETAHNDKNSVSSPEIVITIKKKSPKNIIEIDEDAQLRCSLCSFHCPENDKKKFLDHEKVHII